MADNQITVGLNVPMALTIGRLLSPGLIIPLILSDHESSRHWAVFFFSLVALSDWADGLLARRWNQVSLWGQVLDPIADKITCLTILFALVMANIESNSLFIVVCLILVREFTMAGLREALATRIRLPVTQLSRAKTFLSYIAIVLLISGNAAAEISGLWILILSLIPSYITLLRALSQIKRA